MKSTDKITHEMVVELLHDLGLEYNNRGTFWCCESEEIIDSTIKGNSLKDLLQFIKNYYYDMAYKYGKQCGRSEKVEEIKKILEIN